MSEVRVEGADKHVVVVGGGIGGITAALDLASCGVRVTMVEAGPSIGGRMIQLDKTFPTLDCSTCTLSPKMVEVALKKNIDLLSWTRPVSIEKSDNGFSVRLLKKSRFVDTAKCNACGACSAFCPVVMKSEFNMGTGPRKAIYIPFPQAIPNKASIDKRRSRQCHAACIAACPVHTNVPGYLKHASEGRFEEAYLLIRQTNPFPSVCGRVCYAPCEGVCNRGEIDQPLAIRDVKRAIADLAPVQPAPPQLQKTGKRAMVVGAGPAGLACAHDLALAGHDVTVFEALPEPGGMLRYAIPEYRLPKSELAAEIEYIRREGVRIECGVAIGKDLELDNIASRYDSVFIGTGAPRGIALNVPGEDIPGVIDGLTFLRAVESSQFLSVGKRAAVIGGGNTAVDCARTARRLGSDVTVIYRRTASGDARSSRRSGGPRSRRDSARIPGRACSVHSRRRGAFGDRVRAHGAWRAGRTGRRRPLPVAGSEFRLPVDMAITALGQSPQTSFAAALSISIAEDGTIKADPATGATDRPGVFAGGDVATGPAYVIDAIAAGKRAAASMDLYMKGEPLPVAEAAAEAAAAA